MKKYKVVFAGTPRFAVPFLEAIKNASFLDIETVITEPDKPAGRGRKFKQSPVADYFNDKFKPFDKTQEITLLKPNKIGNCKLKIENLQPDLAVVVAYGQIIPTDLLNIPKYGAINVHPSDLPKYRGASPIQTALLKGNDKTAVSVMKMDKKMDHGPILGKLPINIDINDDYFSLEQKILKIGPEFLIKSLKKLLDSQAHSKNIYTKQNHKKATFTKMIKKSYGQIDWSNTPLEIHNKIRAYCAWPKAYTMLKNGKRLIFLSSKYTSGKLKPVLVQLEGKKATSWQDFINGNKNIIPDNILSKKSS